MEYTVSFYRCGVTGIPQETYTSLRKARKAGSEFLRDLLPLKGHRRRGSLYADNYATIVDHHGWTEAQVSIRQDSYKVSKSPAHN